MRFGQAAFDAFAVDINEQLEEYDDDIEELEDKFEAMHKQYTGLKATVKSLAKSVKILKSKPQRRAQEVIQNSIGTTDSSQEDLHDAATISEGADEDEQHIE